MRNHVKKYVAHPEGGWQDGEFGKGKKSQKAVYRFAKVFFPGVADTISFDDRKSHGLRFASSDRAMEADVLIKDLKIVIEFNGFQHYMPSSLFNGDLASQKARDEEKRHAFEGAGYCVIEVPYTWDGSPDSLLKLIRNALREHPNKKLGSKATKELDLSDYSAPLRRCDRAVSW